MPSSPSRSAPLPSPSPARRGVEPHQGARAGSREATKSMLAALKTSDFSEALRHLSAGADPNALDPSGISALAIAAGRLHRLATPDELESSSASALALTCELARKGALIDHLDPKGSTPFLHAAFANNSDRALALLSFGANPNLPDRDGLTPLMIALINSNQELAAALLKSGAVWGAPIPNRWKEQAQSAIPNSPVALMIAAWGEAQALSAAAARPNASPSLSRL